MIVVESFTRKSDDLKDHCSVGCKIEGCSIRDRCPSHVPCEAQEQFHSQLRMISMIVVGDLRKRRGMAQRNAIKEKIGGCA
jgi:hypothetical protein